MNVQEIWNQQRQNVASYYSANSKKINYITIAILAIVGGLLYWNLSYIPSQNDKAGIKLAKLHYYFKNDSMDVVLKGSKTLKITGAPEIADDYFGTPKGREAAMMAGIAYVKTKKFEKALEYLKKAEAKDKFVGPALVALQASCESELGNYSKAAGLYEKAASLADVEFAANYLRKAGIHYEKEKDYSSALKCYETISKKYNTSPEGSDIDKYIYKCKALMGEFNP